jgi:hypothetical protein
MEGTELNDVSVVSSFDGDLSSTDASSQKQDSVLEVPIEIAATETRWIKRSKCLVITVLLLGTSLCAYGAFTFTTQKEENDFENQVSLRKMESFCGAAYSEC